VVAYQCTFEGTGNEGTAPFKISNCVRVKGYAIDGDNIIQCSGWRREGCIISTKSSDTSECSDTSDEGKILGNGSGICFGTTNFAIEWEADGNEKYVAFEAADYNPFYGLVKNEIAFLHLNKISQTASSILVTESTEAITSGYHRNAAVNDSLTKALIQCKESETENGSIICTSLDAFNGYYLNSGSDTTTNQILTCIGSGDNPRCAATPVLTESCGAAGAIIKKGDNVSLCLIKDASSTDQIIITNVENGNSSYKTLEIASANDFPGTTAGENSGETKKNPIKIRPDGSVILLEDTSLPKCKTENIPTNGNSSTNLCFDNAGNNEHCISDNKIYESVINEDKTKSCTEVSEAGIKYFTKEGLNVNLVDVSTADMAYQCTGDDGSVTCTLAKGITSVTENGIVYCNGWIDEKCQTVSTTDISSCGAEDIDNGAFGTVTVDTAEASGLCFTSNNVITLPTDESQSVLMAFEFSKTSSVYGQMAGTISVLTLTNESALIKSDYEIEGKKYFFKKMKFLNKNFF